MLHKGEVLRMFAQCSYIREVKGLTGVTVTIRTRRVFKMEGRTDGAT